MHLSVSTGVVYWGRERWWLHGVAVTDVPSVPCPRGAGGFGTEAPPGHPRLPWVASHRAKVEVSPPSPTPPGPCQPRGGLYGHGLCHPLCHWHALGSKQPAQPGGRAKRHVPDPAPTSAISTSLPSSHSTVWEQTGLSLPGLGTLQKVTRAGCGAVSWLQNRGFWFLRAQHSSLWPEGRAEVELGAGGDSMRL